MKDGWQLVKLNEVCNIINGRNQKLVESPDGEYPIYGSGGIMGYATDYLCEAGATIIGRKGSINNPIYVETRFWNVDTAFGLLPKPCMNSRLFHYFCLSFDFTKMNKGTTIPSLVKNDLLQIDVPYNPSISEQQRIVGILDAEFEKIDALKANAEKNLQNAKDLFQAALKKELKPKEGWNWMYLPSIAENLDSKRIPITQKDRTTGTYPYYGASGIVDYVSDYLFDDELLLISEDGANLLARSTPIAFSVAGKIWVNNHAHILKFKDKATQKIVEYYIESITIDDYVTGAAQPKLTQANMNKIPIPMPPYDDRPGISHRIETLKSMVITLQDNYTQTLALCDDLKQALLRKAFNGEL